MSNKEITKKKIFLRTFGCQMNERDSEFVTGILLDAGFRKAASEDKADVVIFNSCSVRKHAEDRLFSNIMHLKKLKESKPEFIIGLMGCTAQAYKAKAFKIAPVIDFVCGPGNEHELPAIIEQALKGRHKIIATDKVSKARPELFPKFREKRPLVYVSIGEGCNNFCSYCIVPYVRGRERSRKAEDVIREVKDLAKRGFKEIMLLGQNVNSFKGIGFVELLERLNEISGIESIRFMTSHPKDASKELFKAMGRLDKVQKRLHLPIQSGSDRILKLMNRGYTKDKYLKLAGMYRKLVPGGEITTDIIVGFPTETENDFRDTVKLMRKVRFDGAYIFKYSPRPPARSAKLKDDVLPQTKQKRLVTILKMQQDMAGKRRDR